MNICLKYFIHNTVLKLIFFKNVATSFKTKIKQFSVTLQSDENKSVYVLT